MRRKLFDFLLSLFKLPVTAQAAYRLRCRPPSFYGTLLCLATAAGSDTTPRLVLDTTVPYSSTTWPVEQWTGLKKLRDMMGTMNGPREIYPVQDDQPIYNATQYLASFAELSAFAVRFNDLNYGQGGLNSTSITQIFSAWPLSDAAVDALSSADIAALAASGRPPPTHRMRTRRRAAHHRRE